MRRDIVDMLAIRPQHGLNAQANSDLRFVWEEMVNTLKNGTNGLAFSSLYNRWLIHDPLSPAGINTVGVPEEDLSTPEQPVGV
jgi:hypothetical protein